MPSFDDVLRDLAEYHHEQHRSSQDSKVLRKIRADLEALQRADEALRDQHRDLQQRFERMLRGGQA